MGYDKTRYQNNSEKMELGRACKKFEYECIVLSANGLKTYKNMKEQRTIFTI